LKQVKLHNKTAIITGAAGQGMGRSIALTLAREGANVVINYRSSEKEANKVVDYIQSNNGKAITVKADVFSKADCKHLVEETVKAFSSIDILVIVPGAGWNMEPISALNTEKSLEDINNEVSPIYNLLPLILPKMYENKWGRIIGISLLTAPPSPAYSYNVAKEVRTSALLNAVNDAWKNNVTINVLSPGPVDHVNDLEKALHMSENEEEWISRKNITPQDIGEAAAFLCSEGASYITGTEVKFRWK
jgi:NAD(P)-dependent dehydrogenase (short-subunit alcohol dehydrogenase family)